MSCCSRTHLTAPLHPRAPFFEMRRPAADGSSARPREGLDEGSELSRSCDRAKRAGLAKFESEVCFGHRERDKIRYVWGVRRSISRYCVACESYSNDLLTQLPINAPEGSNEAHPTPTRRPIRTYGFTLYVDVRESVWSDDLATIWRRALRNLSLTRDRMLTTPSESALPPCATRDLEVLE